MAAKGLPVVIERSNHYLDATISWQVPALPGVRVKFGCQNLLDRATTQYQGHNVYYSYLTGRQFKLGASYDIY